MKKSKVLVPALAVLAFSTAASITGTVAWFTANRVATVTAGEFAVVNTSSDLAVSLAAGVGTGVTDSGATHTVTTTSGYKLTDGSFDHTTTAHNIVAPDVTGTKIGAIIPLASGSLADLLERDDDLHIYTAFTWDITFTVTFAGSANKDLGLFFDLSSNETYMHEKKHFAVGDEIPASTYYDNAACTGDPVAAVASVTEAVDYYKASPDDTGKAFRIAFVPTAIGGTGTQTSEAYAKVWAANEVKGYSGFVATSAADVDDDLPNPAASYSTATTKLTGNGTSSTPGTATAGTDMVLFDSSSNAGIPADNTVAASTALTSQANYLGLFKLDAGKTVSLTFTCVAWYDGTDVDPSHGHIVNGATEFENIVTSMKFGVSYVS